MICSNQNVARAVAFLSCFSAFTTLITLLSLNVEHDLASLLALPIINNHNFSYIHNHADVCAGNPIDVLLAVPSAVANFEKRQAVRNGSRGDFVANATNRAVMLFFLGKPSPQQNLSSIQNQIDEEDKIFGDIIQENFEDVYKNNRLKSVAMLRWVTTYCTNIKYVIRTDDDIIINMTSLVPVLERTANTLVNFIVGKKKVDDEPARDVNSKYYMSVQEYPQRTLPPYLLGGLMGFPVSTAKLLYEAALRVKPIWLEDVYISGLCAARLDISILSDPEFTFEHKSHTQ
ncbi:hypothetical protein BsWGS_10946 [Bradybaena similaris]